MIVEKTRDTYQYLDAREYLSFDQGKTKGFFQDAGAVIGGHQEILTENHPGFFRSDGGDQGGPFSSRKTEIAIDSGNEGVGSFNYGYDGPLGILGLYERGSSSISGFPVSASNDSVDRLFALGGTAISRTLPTNPVGGAATFLGELRQGFPSLIGSSLVRDRAKDALKAQKAGHEYLNVEFGWKPLIADIRKFALGVKKHDQIVSQLSRDSGRNVRRRYHFPVEESDYRSEREIPHALGTARGGALASYLYAGPGKIVDEQKISKTTWFSGCYTYHLPDYNEVFGVKRYVAEADKVLGVKLTPEVLWNLAPWSWAADWFANTGDVMNNLSQFSQNDLVMRYGYLMQKAENRYRITATQPLNTWNRGVIPHRAVWQYTATSLRRVPASPFGFGFTFTDFNPRQLAITAALGISRVR